MLGQRYEHRCHDHTYYTNYVAIIGASRAGGTTTKSTALRQCFHPLQAVHTTDRYKLLKEIRI
jgi:hypothetical protein